MLWAAAAAAVLLPTATAAARPDAALPQKHGRVDLRRQANVTIVGAKDLDFAGRSSADAGDVNGDGIDDVIVGAHGVDGPGRPDAGAAYVVFGRRTTAQVRRASLTARGFRILGPAAHSSLGISVAPAGDVDGDGLGDVIIGRSSSAPPGAGWDDGAAWIVYGKRDGAPVDLATPGPAATKLSGPPTFGTMVAGGRDVDGDGRPDVVVSAPGSIPAAVAGVAPGAYVIRGSAERTAIDVRAAGDRVITLHAPEYVNALALTTDMNGDGRAEVALGVETDLDAARMTHATSSTLARVVYGRPAPATVELGDDLGHDGFVVRAPDGAYGLPDRGLAAGGDVNGDGRGDLVVSQVDAVHVVFGGPLTGTVDVGGSTELTIAARPNHGFGHGVAIVGDVNGDGLDDVLAGDPAARALGRPVAGRAYLMFGRRQPGRVGVARLGPRLGFWLAGAHRWDATGYDVAPAGDFNGDGRADLLLAGQSADSANDARGVAYIVYGFGPRG